MSFHRKVCISVTLATACALAGCAARNSQPAEPPALSFAEQVTLVRDGHSERILTESPVTDADLERCANLPNLGELLLDDPQCRVSSAGLQSLKTLPNLWHLRIRGPGIDDAALAQLAELRKLRILNLPQGTFSDAGLAQIVPLTSLEQLRFGSPHVTDAGLKAIGELPQLKRLHLIDVRFTAAGLRDLAKIETLESLYIDGAELSEAAIDELFVARPTLHVHFNQEHHDRDPHGHAH